MPAQVVKKTTKKTVHMEVSEESVCEEKIDGTPEKAKKDKKSKKRKLETEAPKAVKSEPEEPEKKKKKKTKAEDNTPKKQKKNKEKKIKIKEENDDAENGTSVSDGECADENGANENGAITREEGDFENFRITAQTVAKLKARNVVKLFPVQYKTFDFVYDGWDVITQARTGTGKTLAFSIPLVERLQKEGVSTKRGRAPSVIVLAPTRELAIQVYEDFKSISTKLTSFCVYGGTPYPPQNDAINRGLDILVGTPGRIQDHVRSGRLNLSELRHVVLDEVDRMLEMGMVEQVDEILEAAYKKEDKSQNPQTLFFSATLPNWVHEAATKYMKAEPKHVDMIGTEQNRSATTVEHLAIRCGWQARAPVIADIVTMYSGQHGRAMVFCETKKEANQLVLEGALKQEAQVLHGDIPQAQRELTLKSFRDGNIQVLVATDVAARGLDIPEVDLVVQCEPPSDVDSYIHRSGRTGRAGRTGVCVCFYKPNREQDLRYVERRAGIKFRQINAPQPDDIVKAAANDSARAIEEVPDKMLTHFQEAAEKLIAEKGAVNAVAAALAVMSGSTEIKKRSLLNADEGYTTLLFHTDRPVRGKGYFWTAIKRRFGEDIDQNVKGMTMFTNNKGVAFDVPSSMEDQFLDTFQGSYDSRLEVATELPDLEQRTDRGGRGGRGFGRGGFGRGGDRRGGRGRGGGGRFNGGGRGRGGGFGANRGSSSHTKW
ncbi:PREDICTED: nucleolar RNA helicase 2-like [Branchiostoma belcheri]|uniref:RNA helicase n=1 Tax=Branchiostoma belcheri TaxID=7741 RepID=A0A6P4ZPN3_BRABE|nr:PREDICTED: nucleolar RNA helicase 2-like [Branchiostoma belcheri]